MGSGSWSSVTYSASTARKVDTGTTFGYTTTTSRSVPRDAWKAHEDLDPKKENGSASPLAGRNIRESRDSTEHPTSTPVAVWFDETGSMGNVPRTLQTKLTELFGLLLRKGYLEHPQVMMGAYGDTTCDRVPLQVSQFESDNRIDDALDNIFLEGNGGGNNGESQWAAWYYTATHTATDAWEKRSKKGYAFFIGDEWSLEPSVSDIQTYIGDGQPLCDTSSREAIVKALKEKWEPYVLVIDNGAAKMQDSVRKYTELFGKDNVIVVQDESAIAETIALIIGMSEGTIDLDDGVKDLKEVGASDAAITTAKKALAHYSKNKGGVVVSEESPAGLDTADNEDEVTRI